ncbi:MAG: CoA-binding protein [Spirochaetes bacterium]|nr:CoA-binding protein [Spirochaetota bacterium]
MHSLVKYFRTMPPVALVGASNDSTKYGNIIFRDLKSKGYTIYPVNPKATSVEGVAAIHSLAELKEKTDVELLIFVIPPKMTLESLQIAKDLGYKKVWLQPGAADAAVAEFLDTHNLQYIIGACVMVESNNLVAT